MARIFKLPKHTTGRTITTKTPYGTTSDMVVTDENILKKVVIEQGLTLVQDDEGYYVTPKNRIDSGLADPFRYCDSYRENIKNQILEQINQYDDAHKEKE